MDAPSITREKCALTDSVQADFRPAIPAFFTVPKLHALDDTTFTGQIDGTSGSAVGDAFPDGEFFRGAISEVDDQSSKFDGTTTYA